LKKPLVFPHLHKAKERGNTKFEEESKITRGMEEPRNKKSRIRRRPRINKEVP